MNYEYLIGDISQLDNLESNSLRHVQSFDNYRLVTDSPLREDELTMLTAAPQGMAEKYHAIQSRLYNEVSGKIGGTGSQSVVLGLDFHNQSQPSIAIKNALSASSAVSVEAYSLDTLLERMNGPLALMAFEPDSVIEASINKGEVHPVIYRFDAQALEPLVQACQDLAIDQDSLEKIIVSGGPDGMRYLSKSTPFMLAYAKETNPDFDSKKWLAPMNPLLASTEIKQLAAAYKDQCLIHHRSFDSFLQNEHSLAFDTTEIVRQIIESKSMGIENFTAQDEEQLETDAVNLYVDLHPANLEATLQNVLLSQDGMDQSIISLHAELAKDLSNDAKYADWIALKISDLNIELMSNPSNDSALQVVPNSGRAEPASVAAMVSELVSVKVNTKLRGNPFAGVDPLVSEKEYKARSQMFERQFTQVAKQLSHLNQMDESVTQRHLFSIMQVALETTEHDENGSFVKYQPLVQELKDTFRKLPLPLQHNIRALTDGLANQPLRFPQMLTIGEPQFTNAPSVVLLPEATNASERMLQRLEIEELKLSGVNNIVLFDPSDTASKLDALSKAFEKNRVGIETTVKASAQTVQSFDDLKGVISTVMERSPYLNITVHENDSSMLAMDRYQTGTKALVHDYGIHLNLAQLKNLTPSEIEGVIAGASVELGLQKMCGPGEYNKLMDNVYESLSADDISYALSLSDGLNKNSVGGRRELAQAWLKAEAEFQNNNSSIWKTIQNRLGERLKDITGKVPMFNKPSTQSLIASAIKSAGEYNPILDNEVKANGELVKSVRKIDYVKPSNTLEYVDRITSEIQSKIAAQNDFTFAYQSGDGQKLARIEFTECQQPALNGSVLTLPLDLDSPNALMLVDKMVSGNLNSHELSISSPQEVRSYVETHSRQQFYSIDAQLEVPECLRNAIELSKELSTNQGIEMDSQVYEQDTSESLTAKANISKTQEVDFGIGR